MQHERLKRVQGVKTLRKKSEYEGCVNQCKCKRRTVTGFWANEAESDREQASTNVEEKTEVQVSIQVSNGAWQQQAVMQ